MKAAVCRAFGAPLTIEDLSLASPKTGEVRVDIKSCAICHSDLTYIDGGWGGDLPAVFGHEASGIVNEIGDGVADFAVGDRVVVTLIRSCGTCHSCAQGAQVACETSFPLDAQSPLSAGGETVKHGLRTGAFAEQAVVHQSQLAKIDDDISFEVASLMACGVITGFGAVVNTAQVPVGATVAVIGLGGVGMNCIQGAAVAGANTIIGLDIANDKLTLSKEFGATHAIDANAEDVVEQIKAVTNGRGADYVFVSVGIKRAIDSAPDMLAPLGSMVIVGMPPTGVMTEFDPGNLASYSQKILGSKMGSARIRVDIPYLMGLYRDGRLKLDELISNCYQFDEINEAIAGVKRGDVLRNVVVFE